ncbi:MAG: 50S ribosomal protein L10 [Desulfobacterales bacterium]|nr:50S ribosomal protein L10 [Desulfobacterales bacterium]
MKLDQKQKIVASLREKFETAQVVIVTDYKGLDVAQMNDLRRKLREAEVEYQVVKNTMLIRASKDTDVAQLADTFKGPSAIALAFADPVSPAKVLTQFAKDNDKLEIKAGVMNGKLLDLSAITALSKLPSREELLAQVLAAMNAVPQSLVSALADAPRRLVNVLNAVKDQKEAA